MTAVKNKDSTTHSAPLVEVQHAGDGVAVVTLNSAATRNALSLAMISALHAEIDNAAKYKSVRAVVLSAAGPAFCAGHDLKELTAHRNDADDGRQFFADTMQRCSALMQAIVACPKPVIAAVQGTATAAGCQLVATCDLAVAAKTAKFCTPGVNIGLFCSTPMVALSRNVGRKRAMEMLLLGDMIAAEDAASYGLINRVVAETDVVTEAVKLGKKIALKPPRTVSVGKEAFYRQAELGLAEAYDFASEVMVRNMMQPDAAEGIGAFLEKRPPVWRS